MSNEAKRPSRKGRPNHPIDFKRRLAQQACEGGISVSRLAQEHGINTNMLFKWRRHYLAGLFDQPGTGTSLLPVTLLSPPSTEVDVAKSAALAPTHSASGIEVVFADCTGVPSFLMQFATVGGPSVYAGLRGAFSKLSY